MNPNNLTIKSQEIFQKAQQIAFNENNPNIETEHLLKALLTDDDSPVDFLLKKNNVNVAFVENKVDESIRKLPKISSGEPAQVSSQVAPCRMFWTSVVRNAARQVPPARRDDG